MTERPRQRRRRFLGIYYNEFPSLVNWGNKVVIKGHLYQLKDTTATIIKPTPHSKRYEPKPIYVYRHSDVCECHRTPQYRQEPEPAFPNTLFPPVDEAGERQEDTLRRDRNND